MEHHAQLRHIKEPTLLPFEDFHVLNDARALKEALTGKHDESAAINILTKRSYRQREEITIAYADVTGKELSHDLNSVFSSKALKALLALIENPDNFLAKEVDRALNRMGGDSEVVSEVLCTRSNAKIIGIQLAYQKLFGKTILSVISNEFNLSSDFKDLMSMLLQGLRDEGRQTNRDKAKRRASSVHSSVEEGWSTSTKIFSRLLTHESFDQLNLIFDEYRLASGISMEEAVKATFSGDAEHAAQAIVRAAINKPQFYAEIIESSFKKFRRDDGALIRIFVSRAEIDLETIKREYLKIYHKTLFHTIQNELSGSYKEIMLSLLGEDLKGKSEEAQVPRKHLILERFTLRLHGFDNILQNT